MKFIGMVLEAILVILLFVPLIGLLFVPLIGLLFVPLIGLSWAAFDEGPSNGEILFFILFFPFALYFALCAGRIIIRWREEDQGSDPKR